MPPKRQKKNKAGRGIDTCELSALSLAAAGEGGRREVFVTFLSQSSAATRIAVLYAADGMRAHMRSLCLAQVL